MAEKPRPESESQEPEKKTGWSYIERLQVNEPVNETEINPEKKHTASLEFFFSPHGTAKDLERLRKEVEKADIFIPEMFGCDSGVLEILQLISDGKADLSASQLGDYHRGLAEAINGTHKKILFADVPYNNPVYNNVESLWREAQSLTKTAILNFVDGSLEEACSAEDASVQKSMEATHMREGLIIENIQKIIEAEEKQNRSGRPIRILIQLGTAHLPIYHEIKKDFPNTKRLLGRDILVFRRARGTTENASTAKKKRSKSSHWVARC